MCDVRDLFKLRGGQRGAETGEGDFGRCSGCLTVCRCNFDSMADVYSVKEGICGVPSDSVAPFANALQRGWSKAEISKK